MSKWKAIGYLLAIAGIALNQLMDYVGSKQTEDEMRAIAKEEIAKDKSDREG